MCAASRDPSITAEKEALMIYDYLFCPQTKNNIKYEKKEKREQQAQREAQRAVCYRCISFSATEKKTVFGSVGSLKRFIYFFKKRQQSKNLSQK